MVPLDDFAGAVGTSFNGAVEVTVCTEVAEPHVTDTVSVPVLGFGVSAMVTARYSCPDSSELASSRSSGNI
jgi:hypothetical protein